MAESSSKVKEDSGPKNVLHEELTTGEQIDAFLRGRKANTLVVAECYSENNGFCLQFPTMMEDDIINKYRQITFVRFNAGDNMKGFVECLPMDSYPCYIFYKITERGAEGEEERLRTVDRLVPRDFANTDVSSEDKYFGEAPLGRKAMADLISEWIDKNLKMLKAEEIAREAAKKPYGFRQRTGKTRK